MMPSAKVETDNGVASSEILHFKQHFITLHATDYFTYRNGTYLLLNTEITAFSFLWDIVTHQFLGE